MVVAKNDFAHLGLAGQISERSLDKVYVAIVCGEVSAGFGEIRAAIAPPSYPSQAHGRE